MKNTVLLLTITLALVFSSCNHREKLADAYGNFEADEVIISSEGNGKILSIKLNEGETIYKGSLLAQIDTTHFYLQKQQARAQQVAIQSKIANIKAQIEVLNEQLKNININYNRVLNLLNDGVATQQQKDDIEGQKNILEKQIKANKTNIASVLLESKVIDAQIASIDNQIAKQQIIAPYNGIILEKYAMRGELTAIGKPIYKIADLSTLKLRCYISETYLSSIKLQDEVDVLIDNQQEKEKHYKGKISWIASKAEFTPKTIQTKEERVKLVYALDVLVNNDGNLKIGMPAEVRFTAKN